MSNAPARAKSASQTRNVAQTSAKTVPASSFRIRSGAQRAVHRLLVYALKQVARLSEKLRTVACIDYLSATVCASCYLMLTVSD